MAIATVTLNPAKDRTVFLRKFRPGQVNRAEGEHLAPGGKGINVASFLGDYGVREVYALGLIGEEDMGLFRSAMEARGVGHMFTPLPGRVRENIKLSDLAEMTVTDVNLPGPRWDPSHLEVLMGDLKRCPCRVVVISGSLPPGCPEDTVARLVEESKRMGRLTIVDTSGEPLRLALEAVPHGVKPNLAELSEVLRLPEGPEGILQGVRRLREMGIGLVALSLGADGAVLSSPQGTVLVRPPKVTPITTVGAGDAMVAAMALGIHSSMELWETARLACAFSLCAITRIEEPRVEPSAVRDFMDKIRISEVEG
ncbi:1-phosphofructokinase family hexose kinase [Thermanaerovibrio acidaminovorans]|uniref:1-phosphofructokinase family hexose kinase n=1 Tax=Thermanaerovibrio acidaminovorans TaxID=81462 RepID=UPI0024931C3F|nr:1-phosphofructokinase family hexose kinase [Thermanaerovibrio acidaminovorans]